jgi:hypothetical protein
VASVTSGHPAVVTCVEDERLEFTVSRRWQLRTQLGSDLRTPARRTASW